jgi:exodeoxyribonuclease VII small subunit
VSAEEPTFEQAQRELEQIVERLERGEAGLDETLALWRRGEELYRLCRDQLDGAQGRIEELGGLNRDSAQPADGSGIPDQASRAATSGDESG